MEINKENGKSFGNGRKVMKLWIIALQFQLKKQKKQRNNQNNLLTLTFPCEQDCLTLKQLGRGTGGQFDTPFGFWKIVSSEERVKR